MTNALKSHCAIAIIVVALDCTLSPARAQSDESFEIKYQPLPGDSWTLESDTISQVVAWHGRSEDCSNPLAKIETQSAVRVTITFGAIDSDGNQVKSLTISRLRSKESTTEPSSGETVKLIDSDHPEDSSLTEEGRQELSKMRGYRLEATVDSQGRITAYQTDPEGGLLADIFTSRAKKFVEQDYADFTRDRLRVGESWSLGRRTTAATGTRLGSTSFDLTGTLVRVESRQGVRHALLHIVGSNVRQMRDQNASGPNLEKFVFEELAEFDFARHRFVNVSFRQQLRYAEFDSKTNDTLHIESTGGGEERDPNAAAWMVEQARQAAPPLQGGSNCYRKASIPIPRPSASSDLQVTLHVPRRLVNGSEPPDYVKKVVVRSFLTRT